MMPSCPRCGSPANGEPQKEWNFGQYHVSRFVCSCGDRYNFYKGGKTDFTIPRPFAMRGFCASCKVQNPVDASFCKNCGGKV